MPKRSLSNANPVYIRDHNATFTIPSDAVALNNAKPTTGAFLAQELATYDLKTLSYKR